jgi:hypothetical protein
VEQPTSLIGALNSPHDKSADKQQSLETKPISRGTESSNPAPSSGESATNRERPFLIGLTIGRRSARRRSAVGTFSRKHDPSERRQQ